MKDEETIDKVFELYENGYDVKQISFSLGISEEDVIKILNREE